MDQYVRGQVHTNCIESSCALSEHKHKGIFYQLSAKHLHRCINEFVAGLNMLDVDTLGMMRSLVRHMVWKWLNVSTVDCLDIETGLVI